MKWILKSVIVVLISTALLLDSTNVDAQNNYIGDSFKYVANKGIVLSPNKSFPGIFRIKYRVALGYISIEGKRYLINEHHQNVRFHQGQYPHVFYVTEILPEYLDRQGEKFIITTIALSDEGGSFTIETNLYDSDENFYAMFWGGPYRMKWNTDGSKTCIDCFPEKYNQY